MKTVFKRLISSLLLVVMLVAAVPASLVSAAAADIDWEALKNKYGLTDSQIDAAKDIADDYGLTQEQVDAVEEYYDSLTPEEQEDLKESVKNGEIDGVEDLPGAASEEFVAAMLVATLKKAAKDILNRVVDAMEGVTVKNAFDIDRVYDENGDLAGLNFVLQNPEDVNVLETVESFVKNHDVLASLKMVAGAVLLFDEVSVNGYTVYDLADPSDIRNALVEIYRSNPIEFSTIANMEGNTLATYNFSLSCRGVELQLPVSFVIECSEATLNKIKSAAAKLADMVEVNGDFTEEDGVFSADLEGILDLSDYTDNVLGYLLPEYLSQEYALVREKLHALSLNDFLDQINLENLQRVAAKLGRTAEFNTLVNKIAARFHLDTTEPNDLKALIRVIDEQDLLTLYVKAVMQKAAALRAKLADMDAEDLKKIALALDEKAQLPAIVKLALVQAYGENAELISTSAAKLKAVLLALEEKAELPIDVTDSIRKAYAILKVEEKMNMTVGSFYNGDGSYSFTVGNGFAPMGFSTYTDAVLDRLLSTKIEDRISKALKAHGYASVEAYVDAVKARYNKIYTGKYDLDMTFTLVLFNVYTVTFVDGETGETIEVQEVVAGDYAADPYYHGGAALNTYYTADKSYENVMSDLVVTLSPKHHLVEEIDPDATCVDPGVKKIYCTIEGCDYAVTEGVDAYGHNYVLDPDSVVEASCGVAGEMTFVCTRCGDSITEEIPALEHDWFVVDEEPAGCTNPGSKYCICLNCGAEKDEEIPALGHDYVGEVVKGAVCTIRYTCTRCGDTYDDTNAHTWGEGIVLVPQTCLQPGRYEHTCLVCGFVGIYMDMSPLPHEYEVIDEQEATCDVDGYVTERCVNGCNDERTVIIPATGHTFEEYLEHPATCIHPGRVLRYCVVCDYFEEAYTDVNGPHTYEEVARLDASCTNSGYVHYTCIYCGDNVIEILPALRHAYDMDAGVYVPSTCITNGSITFTCVDCGYEKVITLPLGKHDWGNAVILKPATCNEEGEIQYSCTVCGITKTEAIPATGEHRLYPVHIDPYNCHTPGYDYQVCAVCNEKIDVVKNEIYYPPLNSTALNMAFIDGYLLVKIDRMTVGEFKTNFYEDVTVYDKNGNEMDDSSYVGTGCTFVCGVCGTEFTVAVIADINGDGKVNSLDYMYVKRSNMGTHNLAGAMLAAADVNVDCKSNIIDYGMVKLHVMYRYDIYANFPAWDSIQHLITGNNG